jgi:hypothetical protein
MGMTTASEQASSLARDHLSGEKRVMTSAIA